MTNIVNDYQEKMAARAKMDLEISAMYEDIITNKAIDLETRWCFFIDAPTEFKKHTKYIHDFNTIYKHFPNFSWYDDMNIEKYETLTMQSMIDRFYDKAISYNTYEYAKKDKIGKVVAENADFLTELKEEILTANMGSMQYNW